MTGAVLVDFAGTEDEARSFAKENNVNYAKNLGQPNGLPMLSKRYRNKSQLGLALDAFATLGWDRDSVIVTKYGKR